MPLVLVAVLLFLTACSGQFPQSALTPKSDLSAELDGLFVTIMWWGVVVFVLVEVLLIVAIIRYRAKPGGPMPKPVHGHTALEIGWTLAPALILVFIAVPTMRSIFNTYPKSVAGELRVEVIGHQWWWEYRYPALGISAVNELHVPAGTPVRLDMTSADVAHSFWAPALFGKRDLLKSRNNMLVFRTDSVGEYWGQCAEFCGVSHANMRLRMVVQTDSAFQAWVDGQRAPAAAPARGSDAERGLQVYRRSACIGCHTIAGVSAAKVAPDLTHLGSRSTIAGAMFPNTTEALRNWIRNAPAMKPGALMPPQTMPDADLDALVAYVQSLK